MTRLPRCGVFGGTFDPVHTAHMALARLLADTLRLDQLILVPAGNSWQKPYSGLASSSRLAMLELALGESGLNATIDTREMRRSGPSYTVDTLSELRDTVGPETALILLIGADQLGRLDTWHRWKDLFVLAHVAVAGRPGYSFATDFLPMPVAAEVEKRAKPLDDAFQKACGDIVLIEADLGEISSSDIRSLAHSGDYARMGPLVSNRVLDYIRNNHLYRD